MRTREEERGNEENTMKALLATTAGCLQQRLQSAPRKHHIKSQSENYPHRGSASGKVAGGVGYAGMPSKRKNTVVWRCRNFAAMETT